jgi:hypothetical protein
MPDGMPDDDGMTGRPDRGRVAAPPKRAAAVAAAAVAAPPVGVPATAEAATVSTSISRHKPNPACPRGRAWKERTTEVDGRKRCKESAVRAEKGRLLAVPRANMAQPRLKVE